MIVSRRIAVPDHQEKLLQADANGANQCFARKTRAEETRSRDVPYFEDEQHNFADLARAIWKRLTRRVDASAPAPTSSRSA